MCRSGAGCPGRSAKLRGMGQVGDDGSVRWSRWLRRLAVALVVVSTVGFAAALISNWSEAREVPAGSTRSMYLSSGDHWIYADPGGPWPPETSWFRVIGLSRPVRIHGLSTGTSPVDVALPLRHHSMDFPVAAFQVERAGDYLVSNSQPRESADSGYQTILVSGTYRSALGRVLPWVIGLLSGLIALVWASRHGANTRRRIAAPPTPRAAEALRVELPT